MKYQTEAESLGYSIYETEDEWCWEKSGLFSEVDFKTPELAAIDALRHHEETAQEYRDTPASEDVRDQLVAANAEIARLKALLEPKPRLTDWLIQPMTSQDLLDCKERLTDATKGPWAWWFTDGHRGDYVIGPCDAGIGNKRPRVAVIDESARDEDVRFIMHSYGDISRLLVTVKDLAQHAKHPLSGKCPSCGVGFSP